MASLMRGARPHILAAVGGTPIVRLNRVGGHCASEIYVKCEYLNPGGSMKDRIAINIVDEAERRGELRPGGTIVEATSGNTGMGLALVAAVRGYRAVFVMPDKMSAEKIRALRAAGAKVVMCPTNVEPDDPRSYYRVSRQIADDTPNAFYANQYHNPANPDAHYRSTGPELWQQTGGEFDVFCAGMGTGGTLSGTGKYLKEQRADIKIVGVDPVGSLYYEYWKSGRLEAAHPYKVEGIGEDFLPSTMNLKILDDVVRVTDKECFMTARDLVRSEGILCGGSAGAAVAGAVKYAERLARPQRIVVHLPDSASRYLSKFLDDEWMLQNGYLDPEPSLGLVRDLLNSRGRHEVHVAQADDRLTEVVGRMKRHGISQLPVLRDGRLLGVVAEKDVLGFLVQQGAKLDRPVADLIDGSPVTVGEDTHVQSLSGLFNAHAAVLVLHDGQITGMVTKIDLIEYMAGKLAA